MYYPIEKKEKNKIYIKQCSLENEVEKHKI
jgi:hypothetical protein